MIKNWSHFLLALALSASAITVGLPAQAAQVCKVTDPTGTPLNVRSQPNGRVINSLKNGREVTIEAITNDSKGRAWAKVGGYDKGKYRAWGWVLREFISCYES
ncbi:SH3 domain-containing protein [Allocoleopsis sp.]|uniref:SH3 domain-containing protein n=1 Tax=Allocoleopsis sp. TaxID=3088169 RepID=UPI002FD0EC22